MKRLAGTFVLCMGMAAVGCQDTTHRASSSDISGGDKSMVGGAGSATMMDKNFFMKAAAGGTYEVQSSQMALDKSGNTQVKGLAQHMIDDHKKANDELMMLARSKNVDVTPAPDAMQKDMLTKLNGLSGMAFDQEYLRQQQQAHMDTIALFQAATHDTSEPVKMWASKTLPTLQEHLSMVKSDMAGMGNSMGTAR